MLALLKEPNANQAEAASTPAPASENSMIWNSTDEDKALKAQKKPTLPYLPKVPRLTTSYGNLPNSPLPNGKGRETTRGCASDRPRPNCPLSSALTKAKAAQLQFNEWPTPCLSNAPLDKRRPQKFLRDTLVEWQGSHRTYRGAQGTLSSPKPLATVFVFKTLGAQLQFTEICRR
ncbi:hypothetical protein ACE6H2_001750 [Prunus campanulata]